MELTLAHFRFFCTRSRGDGCKFPGAAMLAGEDAGPAVQLVLACGGDMLEGVVHTSILHIATLVESDNDQPFSSLATTFAQHLHIQLSLHVG